MNLRLFYFLFLFTFIINANGFAQEKKQSAEMTRLMAEAQEKMAIKDYEGANIDFRKILALKEVLPNDLSYLFAETLYMIGQIENSHNFLDKYLSATGESGDYAEQAHQLEVLLDEEFKGVADCNLCDVRGYVKITCPTCQGKMQLETTCHHCKGKGLTTCPKCYGEGISITVDQFGNKNYLTCSVCKGLGYVPCPVCEGKKTLFDDCRTCLGSGQISSNIVCDHQPIPE